MDTINNEGKGRLERLEEQVQKNLAQSRDYMFSDYLRKMNQRIIEQKYQIDLLQNELDRNCRQYQQKQEQMQTNVVESVQAENTVINEQTHVEQVESQPKVNEPVVQHTYQQEPELNQEQMNYQQVHYQQSDFNQEQHAATQAAIQQAWQQNVAKSKKSAEFTIGATVLSIVGGVFILIALVMLGMNYMNDIVKGIGMYAISLAIFLISELFIYKKLPKLGAVLTGIGIGGLYLSTTLNYSMLQIFNEWVTILVLLAITVVVFWLNRKRESTVLRIFSLIICYLCFSPLLSMTNDVKFYIWILATFAVNVFSIVLSVKKNRDVLDKVQMGVNAFFTYCFLMKMWDYQVSSESLLVLFFTSVLVVQVLFVLLIKRSMSENRTVAISTFVVYWICNFLNLCMATTILENACSYPMAVHGSLIAVALICAVLSAILWKSKHKWHLYIYVATYFLLPYGCCELISIEVCLLIVLVLTKLLAFQNVKSLRVLDVCVTTLVALKVIFDYDHTWSYAYLGATIISILLIKYWQTYYEIILIGAVLLFTYNQLTFELQIPAIVGILLVALLLFNNVKRFRGKNIVVFNVVALVIQIICHLVLALPMYEQEYLTYLCTLVFGVATIMLTLQEHYHINVRSKNVFFAVYLTYMALIFDWEWPIINSIFMMLIALVCVGVGFADRQKEIRIYGLVLSLIICGKIALYDFHGIDTMQKIILFFSVGSIALVISGIYIILEKRTH